MDSGASGDIALRGGRRRGGLVCGATATALVLLFARPAAADKTLRVDADAQVGWGVADLEHHRPTSGLGVGGRLAIGWCASCSGQAFLWGGPFLSYLHVVGDSRDRGDAFGGGFQGGIFLGERETEPVYGLRIGIGGGYAWQHLDAPIERSSEEGAAFHYHAELVYQHPISRSTMAEFGLGGSAELLGGDDKSRVDAVALFGATIGLTFRP